jgi:hypothetical protein
MLSKLSMLASITLLLFNLSAIAMDPDEDFVKRNGPPPPGFTARQYIKGKKAILNYYATHHRDDKVAAGRFLTKAFKYEEPAAIVLKFHEISKREESEDEILAQVKQALEVLSEKSVQRVKQARCHFQGRYKLWTADALLLEWCSNHRDKSATVESIVLQLRGKKGRVQNVEAAKKALLGLSNKYRPFVEQYLAKWQERNHNEDPIKVMAISTLKEWLDLREPSKPSFENTISSRSALIKSFSDYVAKDYLAEEGFAQATRIIQELDGMMTLGFLTEYFWRHIAAIEIPEGDESALAQKQQLLKLIEAKMNGLNPPSKDIEQLYSKFSLNPSQRALAFEFALAMRYIPDFLK